MSEEISMKIIGHIKSDFPTKFGIPRQSGLVEELKSVILFEPEFQNPDALRGLSEYSHIWLLWQFSQTVREEWSPTVRPPRLGGNKRVGVFATRSPFRPNAIGLSCVRLEEVKLHSPSGPVLYVSGADLMDGTPILDIKPYLPYVDSHPDARGSFAEIHKDDRLKVEFPEEWKRLLPKEQQGALEKVLAQDPRPSYQRDPKRVYGFCFGDFEIRFQVQGDTLSVCEVIPKQCKLIK